MIQVHFGFLIAWAIGFACIGAMVGYSYRFNVVAKDLYDMHMRALKSLEDIAWLKERYEALIAEIKGESL